MPKYYSQFKQDKFLDKYFFKGKEKGVFVEIEAYDGVKDSNTFYFEKELDWVGICCEPMPHIFEALMSNRSKKTKNIMCSVTTKDEFRPFIKNIGYCEPFSVLKDDYDPRYKKLVENVKTQKGGFHEEITVKCHTLEKIFTQLKVDNVDYLSVDTTGCNMNVFKSIDFDKVYIHIISFESLLKGSGEDIIDFLKTKGYVFVTRLDEDIIMIHEKSKYVPKVRNFTVELD